MMKAHLSVFALSAILIAGMGMAPAFGQSSIVVATDQSSYSDGDTILITGEVAQGLGGYALSVRVISPLGTIVNVDQLAISSDKKFSTTMSAGGSLMKVEGTYTVTVQYGDNKNNSATTSFEFGGVVDDKDPPDPPVDPNVTGTTVSVHNSKDLVGYEIIGGTLQSIMPDLDENGDIITTSLLVSIDATSDGSLTLTIPRTILDALLENGDDDGFFVLVDGEEVDFDETSITSTDRTLTIPFQEGSELIEIIGTFVIPEFGTIAAMILAVAIISIIAVSAKSRLSIVPRY